MTNWPENERPRERLKRYGADGLSEAQLLSIIIGPVRGGKLTSMDLATALLKKFDTLQGIWQSIADEPGGRSGNRQASAFSSCR